MTEKLERILITIFPGTTKNGKTETFDPINISPGDMMSIFGPTGSGKIALINDIEVFAQGDTVTKRKVFVNGSILPGDNCGACSHKNYDSLLNAINKGLSDPSRCPLHNTSTRTVTMDDQFGYSGTDIVGNRYDSVIAPMLNKPSARKMILPFRPDMVEHMNVVPGDIVIGRPSGTGCPVQHVIRVLSANIVTGVITGHVVGPEFSRGKDVKDVKEYHMLGFEGRAVTIRSEPKFGIKHSFLPGSCMMNRSHTELTNMILDKPWGMQVRMEGAIIL